MNRRGLVRAVRASATSEPRDRPSSAPLALRTVHRSFSGGGSAPAKRRARERVGESEGQRPSGRNGRNFTADDRIPTRPHRPERATRMIRTALLLTMTLSIAVPLAQDKPDPLQTRPERTDFEETSRLDDITAFLSALAAKSPLVRVHVRHDRRGTADAFRDAVEPSGQPTSRTSRRSAGGVSAREHPRR